MGKNRTSRSTLPNGREVAHRELGWRVWGKYAAGWAAGAGLLVLALPLGSAIAFALAIEAVLHGEPPHVYVTEERLSRGRSFELIKFRVVRRSALARHLRSSLSSVKALERPENMTGIGCLVHRFYLDELPQLVNIVRGDMTLVGPRPYFAGDWKREPKLSIPARNTLLAGLVGPFQAVKGNVSGLEAVNEIDREYYDFVRSRSLPALLWLDARILCKTIFTALEGKGL